MRDWRAINLLVAILLLLLFNGHFLIGTLTKNLPRAFVYLFSVWLVSSLFLFLRANLDKAGDS